MHSANTKRPPENARHLDFIAAIAFSFLCTIAAGQCLPTEEFASRPQLLVPISSSMVSADLNNDGIPDVAFLEGTTSGRVRVALGTGDGGFTLPTTVTTYAARDVELADFDADGNVDLLTTLGDDVRIRWGNGCGTFASDEVLVTDPNINSTVYDLVIADFDTDDDLDLAWFSRLSTSQEYVVTALNNGDGTFTTNAHSTSQEIEDFGVGDVTGDGIPDLIAREGTALIVYQIDGTLISKQVFETGFLLRLPHVADLNDDGIGDVVAVSALDGSADGIVYIRAFGGGFFHPAEVALDLGGIATKLAVGDVDNDGDIDMAISDPTSGQVPFILNDGSGTLTDGGAIATAIEAPRDITLTELTLDGDLDLLVGGTPNLEPFINGCDASPTNSCQQDLNGDGEVSFVDLLEVLASWGPCPQ